MNRTQAEEIWPVMKAFAEGCEVECLEQAITTMDRWRPPPDPDNPSFSPSAKWRAGEIKVREESK